MIESSGQYLAVFWQYAVCPVQLNLAVSMANNSILPLSLITAHHLLFFFVCLFLYLELYLYGTVSQLCTKLLQCALKWSPGTTRTIICHFPRYPKIGPQLCPLYVTSSFNITSMCHVLNWPVNFFNEIRCILQNIARERMTAAFWRRYIKMAKDLKMKKYTR